MSGYPHQRECTRIPIRLHVEIRSGDLAIRSETTRDISLKGVYVITGQRLPLGAPCAVILYPAGPRSDLQVELEGRVVRVDVAGIAVEFTGMSTDTYFRLKNLLLYSGEVSGEVEENFKSRVAK